MKTSKSYQYRRLAILSATTMLALSACTNFFDEHFMDNANPVVLDVRSDVVVVTDEGYKQVASLQENIDKALAIDSAALLELQAIATEKAFTETASADMYLPALLEKQWPYLDNGSIIDVVYRQREGKTSRVQAFSNAQGFSLTTDDYETIWQKRGADYLTPATVGDIPAFLTGRLITATVGQIAMVTYNYSSTEPDPSELVDFLPYEVTLSELLAYPDTKRHQISGTVGEIKSSISGRFYMIDGDYSIYVYGLTDEDGNKVWRDKGISEGDAITIIGRYSEESGEPQILDGVYVSHTPANTAPQRRIKQASHALEVRTELFILTEEGWQAYTRDDIHTAVALPQSVYEAAGVTAIKDLSLIEIFLRRTYPYAAEKEIYLVAYMGANGSTADEWTYNGTDFVLNTGYVDETMSFERKNDQWVPNISTYLQAQFVGEGQGKFNIHHVNLDGLNYIWRYQAAYGMTASAYVSGSNHRVEDWLVSPNIRLKKSVKPQLTFMQAVRYGNTTDNPTWLNVMVTEDFTGDVTTTEWKKLEWQAELPDGSNWTFLSSGIFDLSEYNGKTIVIGFRYKTDFDGIEVPSAPTWEVQQLLLAEPSSEE